MWPLPFVDPAAICSSAAAAVKPVRVYVDCVKLFVSLFSACRKYDHTTHRLGHVRMYICHAAHTPPATNSVLSYSEA